MLHLPVNKLLVKEPGTSCLGIYEYEVYMRMRRLTPPHFLLAIPTSTPHFSLPSAASGESDYSLYSGLRLGLGLW